jgi:hypothetical protein
MSCILYYLPHNSSELKQIRAAFDHKRHPYLEAEASDTLSNIESKYHEAVYQLMKRSFNEAVVEVGELERQIAAMEKKIDASQAQIDRLHHVKGTGRLGEHADLAIAAMQHDMAGADDAKEEEEEDEEDDGGLDIDAEPTVKAISQSLYESTLGEE